MAKRKIGDAIIRIKYLDSNEYAGTITAYGKIWKFERGNFGKNIFWTKELRVGVNIFNAKKNR